MWMSNMGFWALDDCVYLLLSLDEGLLGVLRLGQMRWGGRAADYENQKAQKGLLHLSLCVELQTAAEKEHKPQT